MCNSIWTVKKQEKAYDDVYAHNCISRWSFYILVCILSAKALSSILNVDTIGFVFPFGFSESSTAD